ncbi:SPL family radical SAM protein [Prosthecobacter sp.]|uniref:SPL family radical SAM protein n=1 Tax=Prosthecobacter sp. TaxID=1965333 RepID=UPI003782F4EB
MNVPIEIQLLTNSGKQPAASSSITITEAVNVGAESTTEKQQAQHINGVWTNPVTINKNNFRFKSLSTWSLNIAVGCNHGCRYCYVPDTSTNKQASKLREFGITDPDAEWGEYVLLRPWDGGRFNKSLHEAETTGLDELNPDGNRAVMLCTMTDPYQVLKGRNAEETAKLNRDRLRLVRNSLRRIRDYSTLNVRILTRSPLATQDFDLFKTFGDRLVFGMSLPTLDNDLARIYEPNAPAPSQRLKTLQKAKEAGLHVYVAIAPTYPECTEADIRTTLRAVKSLSAVTIFHEPINIRADNVARIQAHTRSIGRALNTEVFATPEAWRKYALSQLCLVQKIAEEEEVADRLHLWPDKSLKSKAGFQKMVMRGEAATTGRKLSAIERNAMNNQLNTDFAAVDSWIDSWHERISEWPGKQPSQWVRQQLPEFMTQLLKAA